MSTAKDLLEWNGILPTFSIYQVDGPGVNDKATAFYGITADYGWAQRIICTGMYEQDAGAVLAALNEATLAAEGGEDG